MAIDLDELRSKGVKRARFHASGALEEVEFGPVPSSYDEKAQPEQPEIPVTPRKRATGGLVARGEVDG